MCGETNSKNQKQRFGCKLNVSVRDAIISDDESTETLIYMVRCAKNVLITNHNYSIFRKLIAELVLRIDEDDLQPSFLCGMDEMDQHDLERRRKMIDKFIDQLLRFLAMKVLLDGSNNFIGSNSILESNQKNQEIILDENGKPFFQLNPSIPIRECWKALLMLPLTYQDVCKAFGSDVIDYDEEIVEFRGEESKSEWGRECYAWTIETYTNLYVLPPSKLFWPKLLPKDADEVGLLNTFVTKLKGCSSMNEKSMKKSRGKSRV